MSLPSTPQSFSSAGGPFPIFDRWRWLASQTVCLVIRTNYSSGLFDFYLPPLFRSKETKQGDAYGQGKTHVDTRSALLIGVSSTSECSPHQCSALEWYTICFTQVAAICLVSSMHDLSALQVRQVMQKRSSTTPITLCYVQKQQVSKRQRLG